MSLSFDPVKHGPAVWKLQGLKWSDREIPNARIFGGWAAERLAAVLGLEARDVKAAIEPPPVPAPVPDSAPRTGVVERFIDGLNVPLALPALGSRYAPRRYRMIYRLPTGGWSADARDWDGTAMHPVDAGDMAEVLSVHGGGTGARVLVLLSGDPLQDARAPLVVRVPLSMFARMFAPL